MKIAENDWRAEKENLRKENKGFKVSKNNKTK